MSYNFNPFGGDPFSRARGNIRQPPHQQPPYQQPPYQQYPSQQPPYQQAPYQQPPYQQPPYQQPPYQQPPYQQYPSYQQPGYQQPYGHPSCPTSPNEPPPPYATPKENAGNLIRNPNFQAKCWNENGDTTEFSSDHWEILEAGGDGWRLEKKPSGSSVGQCPAEAGSSAHCLVGSYGWCKRVQYIDLQERGFGPHVMDNEKPIISICEWFCARSDSDSEYYVNVSLLDSGRNQLDIFQSGTKAASSQHWHKIEHNFNNYPKGVRYIRYEDGTKDKPTWAGHFGAKMCQPTVKLILGPPEPMHVPHSFNLLTNPSFTAKYWSGNESKEIDFHPWEIEKNRDGFCLEKEPNGTSSRYYPEEFRAFDVWCISTSNELSQRSQVVDLVSKGYSAYYLDQQRPSIKVCEWFRSRSDCGGLYFMKVSLLDQNKWEIPGCSFDTALKNAPSHGWEKVEHVFSNIPPGVRYVKFRDGGQDEKYWAGNFGVKMVGASVSIISHGSERSSHRDYGSERSSHRDYGSERSSHRDYDERQMPRMTNTKKNLIKNMNLRPKYGWNGETCDEIEFSPWKILEKGGDGLRLEKTPNGSRVGGYPRELGPAQHCIATSFGWFRREQTVDLINSGFPQHIIASGRLQVYICEWFTSCGDCEGEYELKASLLDGNRDELPDCSFDSGISVAPADEWEKVDHVFAVVPPNTRFVKFQDGGKDVKYWSGTFGVKMVGATVMVGGSLMGDLEKCSVM